jgi:hypothetical protein
MDSKFGCVFSLVEAFSKRREAIDRLRGIEAMFYKEYRVHFNSKQLIIIENMFDYYLEVARKEQDAIITEVLGL